MTKAQKIIGCVQHDCAECKTMRRVYDAAMKWARLSNTGTYEEFCAAEMRLDKACAAAKKGKKNGKG
jgi:hypothetical protein